MKKIVAIRSFLVILSLVVYSCQNQGSKSTRIQQNLHSDWQYKQPSDSAWRNASVPGYVMLDLLKDSLITDPFYGNHEKEVQWVHRSEWVYKTTFNSSSELLNKNRIELVFEGLDTYADIYLNDSLILQTNNMFIPWIADVKGLLKEKNELTVKLHDPLQQTDSSQPSYFENIPGKERIFTRKAAYHYGWDWAPRLLPMGIYKPVYLRGWNMVRIINSYAKIESLTEAGADINLELIIEAEKDTNAHFQFEVNSKMYSKPLMLKKGKHHYAVPFTIDNPRLWWVHNLGEPNLYKLKGELILNDEVEDTYHTSFGLRKIQLVRRKDAAGESFGFELNGKKVFMKGANYVPQDVFLSRVDSSDYKELIRQVVDANMNMLRVWGGGVYERDIFYDLCDQHGILVWQDFMFANAMYIADEKFVENIRREAEYQVKRLRNHPCLALWCGNNEIDEAWHNWGWSAPFSKKDSASVREDYMHIFHELLPEIVNQHNPGTDYITSSPKFGRGDRRSLSEGDSHYWGVWHDGYDFSVFDSVTGRFMSEYGFQGFPPFSSVRQFIPHEKLTLQSPGIDNHQKHSRGMEIIRDYMSEYYYVPDNLEDFIYVSQLLQAEGIRKGIEAHRRKKPYCMGTLYWQLNDCWPAISWSSVDYYGQWKALHYFAKEAYKNIIISVKEEKDHLIIYLINDDFEKYDGTLQYELLDFEGNVFWNSQKKVELGKDTSQIVESISMNEWPKKYDLSALVFQTKFIADGNQIDNYLYYFTEPRNLQLKHPEIMLKVIKKNGIFEVKLTSNRLAKNVYLSTPLNGSFSNNYFDMLPDSGYKVNFPANVSKKEFENSLKVKILNEINLGP